MFDFIAKNTLTNGVVEDANNEEGVWELFIDGSSIDCGPGAWFIIKLPGGELLIYGLVLLRSTTNNEVEYKVLITSLLIVKGAGALH